MRKWLTWLTAIAVFLCAGDGLLWLWGTHALAAGVDRWSSQLRAQGWNVQGHERMRGGWPFAASLAIADMRITGGDQLVPGGVAWRTGRLLLSISLTAPTTLSVSPEGPEFLRISTLPPVIFNADHLLALVPLTGGPVQQADLTGQGLTGGISGSRHPQDVRMETLALHLQASRAADAGSSESPNGGESVAAGFSAQLRVAASGIGLPDIGRWPLGANVSSVGVTVALASPTLPIASKVGGHVPAAMEAEAWRRGGGSLALREVALRWGPLTLRGEAQLGLDARLQPAGSGTADISGSAASLDALVDGGVVQSGMGATAKAVLSAMAQLPGGDAVRLPFVLRDNTLSVGPIPLARLNDIVW
jgi:hypothetical protein